MAAMPLGEVIAERRFELATDPGAFIVVRIGKPVVDADGVWQCPYEFDPATENPGVACGEDSVQALLLALIQIGIKLSHPPEALRGQLRWLGEADLGLPIRTEREGVYEIR